MVCLVFGLPGSGKTTLLTKMALEAINDKKHKYENVYCNIDLAIPGLWKIKRDDFGRYNLHNGLILYDEATIDFDSRDFKNFEKKILEFYMMHRHYNVDIWLFAQGWDTTDKRIRQITDHVYYIYKGLFTGKWISKYYPIPYGIDFNNPKIDGKRYGDIVQGYAKPSLLQRILCKRVVRKKYYPYFDSFSCRPLPALPEDRLYLPANIVDQLQDEENEDFEIVYNDNTVSQDKDFSF